MSLLLAAVIASGQLGTPAVGGYATWYVYHEGQAAAAHDLKALIGPDWRGSLVRVSYDGKSVIVRLTDSESSTRDGALIDLDSRDFAKLAPLSRGRIAVMVEVLGSTPLPPTDTQPTLYDVLMVVR